MAACLRRLKITFVDFNEAFGSEITRLIDPAVDTNISTLTAYLKPGEPMTPGTAYISPANSIGYMDGGVDDVLRFMLPRVELRNMHRNRALGKYINASGHSYLPIGSASCFAVGDNFLISTPTMWVPENVSMTQNAFWATRAAFAAAVLWNECHPERPMTELVCFGMATGNGKMTFAQSAGQIMRAYREFDPAKDITPEQRALFQQTDMYLLEANKEEQPRSSFHMGWSWQELLENTYRQYGEAVKEREEEEEEERCEGGKEEREEKK
jgi:hypothetical protein